MNVTVPLQDESIQPLKHANVQVTKNSLTMNADAQMRNHFGMVNIVFPAQKEHTLIQVKINAITALKDSFVTQPLINVNQAFDLIHL